MEKVAFEEEVIAGENDRKDIKWKKKREKEKFLNKQLDKWKERETRHEKRKGGRARERKREGVEKIKTGWPWGRKGKEWEAF